MIVIDVPTQNVSVQATDIAYFINIQENLFNSGLQGAGVDGTQNPILIGEISVVNDGSITINNEVSIPPVGAFILFAKNSSANTSGIKGTFAEVSMTLNSATKGELFSVSAEVKESSK